MRPTPPDPGRAPVDDELVLRYHEASRLEGAAPGPVLRAAVLAQAAAVARERAQAATLAPAPRTHAANDPRWTVPAVASIAVLGLAALLALQFDRDVDEHHDLAPEPQAESAARPLGHPPDPAAAPKTTPPAISRAPTPAPHRAQEQAKPAPVPPPPAQDERAPTDRKTSAGAPQPATAAPHSAARPAARSRSVSEAEVKDESAHINGSEGLTSLMRAAARGDEAQVQQLLAAGADPRQADPQGQTAADYARRAGHTRLAQVLERAQAATP